MNNNMPSLLCIQDLALDDHSAALSLDLAPGVQARCIMADDQQLSRLLRLCTGVVLPHSGRILLDGNDTGALSRQQLLEGRRQIGIVGAAAGLISNLKLWENITLPLCYRDDNVSEQAEQLALTLLDSFGYRGNLLALPGHLSAFERRMAAFIRAAIATPRLMLYAGCFDNLSGDQRRLLLDQAQLLHRNIPEMSVLYLTTSSKALAELQVDISCDLTSHAQPFARTA
jgi:phospholipid/cholesterol/gamma-HCH transport system ATP-binding protein